MKKRIFSIIVPIYKNEENLPHTLLRLRNLQGALPDYQFEYIFVDDGSPDRSFDILQAEQRDDPQIKLIKFTRNFGVPHGVQEGLRHASGHVVGLIAADMQDPPELFVEMIQKWEAGTKVVMAVRKDRDEPFGQRLFSNCYYFLLRRFALKDYPKGGFDTVLLDREVVIAINQIKEKNTNIAGLIVWLGYKSDRVYYTRERRLHGRSGYTLAKKIKFFIDAFVAFSYFPLRFMSFLGILVSIFSFLYGLLIFVNAVFQNIPIRGWATLMVVLSFLLGLIMVMLGVIGEYLWRILDEVRPRPARVVERTLSAAYQEDSVERTSVDKDV